MAERKSAEQKEVEASVEEAVEAAPHQASDGPARLRRKYPRERLILEADAFVGHEPHIVAGALADSDQDEFTVKQVETAIKNWLSPEE